MEVIYSCQARGFSKLHSSYNQEDYSLHHCENYRFFSHLPSKNIRNKIYRIIILPVVLYGCETCSLTLREENRSLRRIFGPMRDEIMGG
jgi:hypothetical protein